MANLNANIASKLISYVRHGVDINSEIKEVYKNSLIFIGDESQIYVPAMNTYVGIGQTAYTNTLERIKSIETQISEMGTTLSADLVSKIYVNYSLDEVNGTNGRHTAGSGSAGLSPAEWALNNEITIKGVGDYDANTGFAKKGDTNASRYHTYTANYYDNSAGTKEIYVTYTDYYSSAAQPTSGITVTPYWGGKTTVHNDATGQDIEKRIGSYITIDDKLTWSYMTSAYAYTLNYARLHTASEIDRLYHNLLGDSVATYLTVSFDSAIEDATSAISKLSQAEINNYNANNPDKYLVINTPTGSSNTKYYILDPNKVYYYAYIDNNTPAEGTTGNKQYVELSYSDIADMIVNGLSSLHSGTIRYTAGDSTISNFPQLYVRDTQYNSTYNINIADGIQTLKEVAYLLDILSDGSLGSVTYYTYSEYNNLTPTEQASAIYVLPQNDNPAATDIYAYIVNTGNPENLGIQIAYSIAGNQAQINDLHSHVEKIEKGKTSIRSIQSTNTEFTTVSLVGGLTQWENTDTNQGIVQQGHPNYDGAGGHRDTPSYVVGDVNFKIALNTGLVYATIYQTGSTPMNYEYVDGFGTYWYGYYTAADMRNLSTETENVGNTAYSSYYTATFGTETGTGLTYAVFTRIPIGSLVVDSHLQGSSIQYYWIPDKEHARNNTSQNAVYEKISRESLMALDDNDYLPNSTIKKGECPDFYKLDNELGYINAASSGNGHNAAYNAINTQTNIDTFYYIAGHKEFVLHANTDGNKIATTQWVGAFVDDSIRDITNSIGNIVEEANNYTKRKIEELDTNYIYSDFATYWTTYVSTNNLTPGTTLYETAYASEYTNYINRAVINNETRIFGTTGPYRLSYVTKSQYTYNIIEEDGIVRAETRELPSDKIQATAEFWGSESNVVSTARHQYAELINDTSYTPLYETLYDWQHETTHDNQLFVPVPNGAKVALDPATAGATPWTANTVYFLTENNTFQVFDRVAAGLNDYTDVNNKNWVQLYGTGTRYDELDLSDWEWLDAAHTILRVSDYILSKVTTAGADQYKIAATSYSDPGTYTYVSYISSTAVNSTKYFSVESKHFTYEHSGSGENLLSVKAHITRIEDASTTNTGFADAYDVQKYIESLFTWVDISATAPESVVNHSDLYYKHISYSDYNGENLYDRVNNDGPEYTYVQNPTMAYFWADDSTYWMLENDITDTPDTDNTIPVGAHTKVNGTYVYLEFFADVATATKYTAASNYYIRKEEPIINPINLTETLYR